MIDPLFNQVITNLPFYEKIVLLIIFGLCSLASFIIFKHCKFLKKMSLYLIGYFISMGVFFLILTFKFLSEKYLFFSSQKLYYILYFVYFVLFIIFTAYPYYKYRGGIEIVSDKKLFIPITGEKLEITLKNKTSLDDEIEIKINLSDNIKFKKEDSRNFSKVFRLGAGKQISISKVLFPKKYDLQRIIFIKIKTNIFGEIIKKVTIQT